MQSSQRPSCLWGCFWGELWEKSDTGKVCLEQRNSHRTRLRGWKISSLMAKQFCVLGKQRQSGSPNKESSVLDGLPSGGPQPLAPDPSSPANTGSPRRSFQAIVPPHHRVSMQAWARCSLLALSSAPPVSCLSWSSGGSRPGCLMVFSHVGWQSAPCSVRGAKLDINRTRHMQSLPLSCPSPTHTEPPRGRKPWFQGSSQQRMAQSCTTGIQ